MPRYRIHIKSTDSRHRWITRFVAALKREGIATDDILYFAQVKEEQQMPDEEAKKVYEAAAQQSSIACVCHLLLQPPNHKHFLVALASLQTKLLEDPKSILIYDIAGIGPDGFFRDMEVHTLILHYKAHFGEQRVLSKDEAIAHFKQLLRPSLFARLLRQ